MSRDPQSAASNGLGLNFLGRSVPPGGEPVEAGAEIPGFDPRTDRLYVTNGATNALDVYDASNPAAPTLINSIDLATYGGSPTSVAVGNGRIAVGIAAEDGSENGKVVVFRSDGSLFRTYEVGVLPDQVTFTPDGRRLLTANEGGRVLDDDDNEIADPEGSISIVNLGRRGDAAVTTLDFDRFDRPGEIEELLREGGRLFPDKLPSTDFEPEYVAVTPNGNRAMVTLQEANAVAIINLKTQRVIDIQGLGRKDHSEPGNGLDASDRDDAINIATHPVQGIYMPDAIVSLSQQGQAWFAIANEGDDRGFDTSRIKDLDLDPNAFPNAQALQADAVLGRLTVSNIDGDTDGDGDFDQLYALGGRSFSVLDRNGNIVFDSGDLLEQVIADRLPEVFNSDGENDSFDSRSDNKGPEPEGLAFGRVEGTPYLFVGMERIGGIAMFDMTDPRAPTFVDYINSRDFNPDVDGTLAQGDISPEGLTFISAKDSPTGKPLLAVAHEISGTVAFYEIGPKTPEPELFELQLLHASDLEGGVDAIENAPNFAAIVERLEQQNPNTIVLSAGDNYISGPFFNAAGDISFRSSGIFNQAYNDLYDLPAESRYAALREGNGRVGLSIMNIIGFDASALGNHEFDLGTGTIADLVRADFQAAGVADDRWVGAQFPYLSANLDFSGDANLASLFTDQVFGNTAFQTLPAQSGAATPKIAPSTFIEVGGERIGVVGATTPLLATISSPGGTEVLGSGTNDMAELAGILQPTIDALEAQGINKIVLVSHLQQLGLEEQLVPLLSGVDVAVAGGSDSILADGDDVLRPGDTAADGYPIVTENADGDPAAIVSTDGEYTYVGRLNLLFDEDGILVPDFDPAENGPIATTAANVAAIWGNADAAFAPGTKGDLVADLVDAVEGVVLAQDGNIFGVTDVFLEGRRTAVRTEETNLGNLTADANLAFAKTLDPDTVISIKNGGGIRAPIGEVIETSPGVYTTEPPQANPDAGKEEGEVSQLDIVNALRFNNGLALVTVTAEQLHAIAEHAVADTAPGTTPGRFPQIAGMAFSFDQDLPIGERIVSLAVKDENGAVLDTVVQNGDLVGDASRSFRVVTLGFLAGGGDGYPFPTDAAANRVDLVETGVREGLALFADNGTEQDVLAEYLALNFGDEANAFNVAETGPAGDERIQNLDARADTVLTAPAAAAADLSTLVQDVAAA